MHAYTYTDCMYGPNTTILRSRIAHKIHLGKAMSHKEPYRRYHLRMKSEAVFGINVP